MLRKSFLIFTVLCAGFLIGCGKTETSNNNNSMSKDGDMPKTTSSPSTTKTVSSGEKIGIAECDDFLAKYDDCITKNVPEAQRAQYESSIKQWRDSWRQLAKNDMTKGTLAAACKQALEQAKSSMKSYNCTF
jgi:hypothetical protein